LDALLDRLEAAGHGPCFFEQGHWRSAAALRGAVQRWRDDLAARLPRAGAVVGLQAPLGFEAVACLLAAWQLRAIVALLPTGSDRDAAAREALCELVLHADATGSLQA